MFILEFISLKRLFKLLSIPVLLLVIESCSNEPIGQELSNSFDSPLQEKLPENSDLKNKNNSTQAQLEKKRKGIRWTFAI